MSLNAPAVRMGITGEAYTADAGATVTAPTSSVSVLDTDLFGLGFVWLRRLARYDMPQRFLGRPDAQPGVPTEVPATVAGWQGGRGDGARLRGRHAMDAGGGPS